MKKILGNVAATIYFVVTILPIALFIWIIPIGMLSNIGSIVSSGFSGQNIGFSFLGLFGLVVGISMLIPTLRKIYIKLPWLYVYLQIFIVNILILTLAIQLLNIGFEVQNPVRHTTFFWLTVAVLVLSRLAMCFYYKLRPIKTMEE